MNDLLDLIVFSPDADQRARRSGALAEMGFSPRRCEDSNGLFRLFQTRRTPLLVMEAELTDLCMAVAGLRAMDTRRASSPSPPSIRQKTASSGCTAAPTSASSPTSRRPRSPPRCRPWCAARRLRDAATPRRRRAQPASAAAGRWQFQDAAWTWSARAAAHALTQAEREFLLKLTSAMDKRLPRSRLRARPQAGRDSVRRTDVVVSRLRRRRRTCTWTSRSGRSGAGATPSPVRSSAGVSCAQRSRFPARPFRTPAIPDPTWTYSANCKPC